MATHLRLTVEIGGSKSSNQERRNVAAKECKLTIFGVVHWTFGESHGLTIKKVIREGGQAWYHASGRSLGVF